MTFRGTGTTSTAEVVENNGGDWMGGLWGVAAVTDYAMGTYLHNVGQPYSRWQERVLKRGSSSFKPVKNPMERYNPFMPVPYPY